MHYTDEQIKKLYQFFKLTEKTSLPKNVICKKYGITYSKFYHLRERFVADSYRYSPRWGEVAGGELSPLKRTVNEINFEEIAKFLEIEVNHHD
jgi:hypothetical protein